MMILAKFPAASRVTDDNGQLALHIAINYAKETKQKDRRRHQDEEAEEDEFSNSSFLPPNHHHQPGHQEIGALLQVYPEALQRRDGTTKLYPFQQAAEGYDGDLELSFMLLRRSLDERPGGPEKALSVDNDHFVHGFWEAKRVNG